MRKRLRKKTHRGEFQELGFLALWAFEDPLTLEKVDAFCDALVAMVDARALTFGGAIIWTGGSGFLCRQGRGSVSEEDREQVEAWLRAWPSMESVAVMPFEDAWYSPNRQYQHILDWLNDEFGTGLPIRIITPPPKP